jgi:dTMP kinase
MTHEPRGRFITVEGQDGAGKTTNLSVIRDTLAQSGIQVVQTREPGGTPWGEALRDLVLNCREIDIAPTAELLTIFAARAQHIHQVIEPALSTGRWVLCDRFTDATYAYQGGGRGVSLDTIALLESMVQGDLRPDLTLLFDVDIDTGIARARQRSKADRFESEQDSFKHAVRAQYLELAKHNPQRMRVIDASRPLEQVVREVRTQVNDFIKTIVSE